MAANLAYEMSSMVLENGTGGAQASDALEELQQDVRREDVVGQTSC